MKAVTLWQPWASAVALQQKRNETRSWPTKYRGPLAIHAAARESDVASSFFAGAMSALHKLDHDKWAAYCECNYTLLPFGEVVAVCELVDCIRAEDSDASQAEQIWGDYSPGRFVWKLANIQKLETPIPALGRQSLWDWESKILFPEAVQLSLL